MNPEDILFKAIEQAEKNGYKEHLNYLPLFIRPIKNLDLLAKRIFWTRKNDIIYSHNFAKAYFGDSDSIYRYDAWIKHLEEMSKEKDDIKYLEKFLKTKIRRN